MVKIITRKILVFLGTPKSFEIGIKLDTAIKCIILSRSLTTLSLSLSRLIVASLDVLLAFDVTDNLFEKLEQVDMSASVVDASARPECLGNWDKSDEVRLVEFARSS